MQHNELSPEDSERPEPATVTDRELTSEITDPDPSRGQASRQPSRSRADRPHLDVRWVRTSDLLWSASGTAAAIGMAGVRAANERANQVLADRAKRLPPLSSFGARKHRGAFSRSAPSIEQ